MDALLRSVDTVRLVVDFGLVVLIWLVQLVIYPSFRHVDPDAFVAWHARYSALITLVVVPLMLAQVAAVAAQLWRGADAWTVASAVLVGAIWLLTFLVSVPAHAALQAEGNLPRLVDHLVSTNAWRTAGWTLVFLCGLASRT